MIFQSFIPEIYEFIHERKQFPYSKAVLQNTFFCVHSLAGREPLRAFGTRLAPAETEWRSVK